MNIYDSCRQALKEQYDKGITQQEIGRRAGISQQHVNRLLNGRSSFANLKMETMLKLLPNASITVGDMSIVNNGTNSGVIGITQEPSKLCAGEIETFRAALIMELIELEIEMSAKDVVLRAVRNFRRRA